MVVEVRKTNNGSVIYVNDDQLMGVTVEELKLEAVKLIDKGEKSITLDLSKARYIDSSGIGKLLFINKKLISNNGRLEIINITETLFDFLQTLAIDKVMTIRK